MPERPNLTDYERYIRTDELLALQKDPEALANPDEMLFQITHQSAELWLKLIVYQGVVVRRHLAAQEYDQAILYLRRHARLLDLVTQQSALLETMAPDDYHDIRNKLGRGSGQESPGFGALLTMLREHRAALLKVLAAEQIKALDVLRAPQQHLALHGLLQACLDLESSLRRFRHQHLLLVQRQIGLGATSLKGVPAQVLERGLSEEFFREIWEAIGNLTDEHPPTYGL